MVTKVKCYTNSVEVHPQLSNNRHPVDGAMVVAGSVWPDRQGSYLVKGCVPYNPGNAQRVGCYIPQISTGRNLF
jgi:hypothetical protein